MWPTPQTTEEYIQLIKQKAQEAQRRGYFALEEEYNHQLMQLILGSDKEQKFLALKNKRRNHSTANHYLLANLTGAEERPETIRALSGSLADEDLRKLIKKIELDFSNPRQNAFYAKWIQETGRHDDFLNLANLAHFHNPKDIDLMNRIGIHHIYQLKEYNSAKSWFEKALGVSENFESLLHLSNILDMSGDIEASEEFFWRAADLNEHRLDLIERLSVKYLQHKERREEMLLRFIENNNKTISNKDSYYNILGNTSSIIQDKKKAEELIDRCIAERGNEKDYLNLMEFRINNKKQVENVFKEAREKFPEIEKNIQFQLQLAKHHFEKRDKKKFFETREKALELIPEEISIYSERDLERGLNYLNQMSSQLIERYEDASEIFSLRSITGSRNKQQFEANKAMRNMFLQQGIEYLFTQGESLEDEATFLKGDTVFVMEEEETGALELFKKNNERKDFKKERDKLKKEYVNTSFIYKVLRDSNKEITSIPLAFAEHEGKAYFFERRMAKETLEERIENELPKDKRIETNGLIRQELELSMKNLATLHGIISRNLQYRKNENIFTEFEQMNLEDLENYLKRITSEEKANEEMSRIREEESKLRELKIDIKPIDYESYFQERVFGSKPTDKRPRMSTEGASQFLAEFGRFMSINRVNFFIHGDYYLTNALKGGYIVDFEKAALGHPAVDLAAHLEHPRITYEFKVHLLREYVKEMKLFGFDIGRVLGEDYLKIAIYNNLCQVGAHLGQGDIKRAREHFKLAINDMTIPLKEPFKAYISGSQMEEFKDLI
ncbi:MAG: hypothetical protein KC535_02685 [Nanoarchaeota archaeon]|nr:hypothetical protein [Nanoarchaeota archaeon]